MNVVPDDAPFPTRATPVVLISLLTTGVVLLAFVSDRFEYGSPAISRPIVLVVLVLVAMGVAYLVLAAFLVRYRVGSGMMAAGLVAGLGLRLVFMASTPIQEDDFYRYLWDGAVTANGYSPYRHSPAGIDASDETVPAQLHQIRERYPHFDRINFPEYTTIYPPAAQAAFSAAYLVRPFSLAAWRLVILLFDLVALWLLIQLLDAGGVPRHRSLIYWLNPILLMDGYNSAHMDVILLPFITAATLFAVRNRAYASFGMLAVATGAKFWPLMLAPLIGRSLTSKGARAAALGGGAAALLLLPIVIHAGNADAGLMEYSRRWEMNDALFLIMKWAAGDLGARVVVGALVATAVVLLSLRPVGGVTDLCNRVGIAIGVLFMLSPTQFPWYYVWMLPFLAVRPRASLLLLSATLPLYYLKFYYGAHGDIGYFHMRVVWIEFAPVILVAAWEAWRTRRQRGAVTA